MSYQSGSGRASVEEYEDTSSSGRPLLPGDSAPNHQFDVNTGAPNSARGGGTTASELVAKFRALNCGACLIVLAFHTLRVLLNPVRLAALASHPVRLMLELIVATLALFLFLVEARVPMLGERALGAMNKVSVGGRTCIDLGVAGGRVFALLIIGSSIGMINYLSQAAAAAGGDGEGDEIIADPTNRVNGTDVGDDTNNYTNNASGVATNYGSPSTLLMMLQCTILSPAALVAFILAGYTTYVMQTYPDYAHSRAYSTGNAGSSDATLTAAPSGGAPSWVSNIGNFVQGSGRGGYQAVNLDV